MKIQTILSQNRRDFRAIYICHCGAKQEGSGYDDTYFHNEVIPIMVCNKCGQTAKDTTEEYKPLKPKYEDGRQV